MSRLLFCTLIVVGFLLPSLYEILQWSPAMDLDEQGWLNPVRQLLSPNHDDRPAGVSVDLVVLHGISLPAGEFGGHWIDALFTNQIPATAHPALASLVSLRVSSHLLIRRDGEIVQYVPFSQRAWHAGQSQFQGRERCNDFSIGIELEGADETPYESEQYQRAAEVIILLKQHYPGITRERIVGHSEIAPGRKTDPGPAFSWEYLDSLLREGGFPY